MTPSIARTATAAFWFQKPFLAAKQAATAQSLEDLAPVAVPSDSSVAAGDPRGQIVDIVA